MKISLFPSDQIFTQYTDPKTDTTIYSFNKLIRLLTDCNPNTIEILGCKPEHYFYISPVGQELLDNAHLFLSKKAVYTFGGYANAQLHRLSNKSNRYVGQAELEKHILKTINHASVNFPEKYFNMPDNAIKLFIDDAIQEDYEKEIFMDLNLRHYPLRDWVSMWSEMSSIVRSFSKIGKRNKNAILHDKIGKHMMHLVRLYYMCFDILERKIILTYREEEHELLMRIRNGEFLDENNQPIKEFYDMISKLEERLDRAAKKTLLPDTPNYVVINDFVISVNERVVKGEIG